MSEPEPELTPEQAESCKQELIAERAQLEEMLKITKSDARPVGLSEPIGRLTRMDAIQQQQMTKATRAGHERKLRLIDSALETFETGDYGLCRSCEEPVGYRRLKARPETPFCLDCQEQRESS